MIEVYKHINTYDKEIIPRKFQLRNRISRKHEFQLIENMPRDGIRGPQLNSFYYRNARTWNDLPREVVNAKTINSFKQKLDEAWKEKSNKFDPT